MGPFNMISDESIAINKVRIGGGMGKMSIGWTLRHWTGGILRQLDSFHGKYGRNYSDRHRGKYVQKSQRDIIIDYINDVNFTAVG